MPFMNFHVLSFVFLAVFLGHVSAVPFNRNAGVVSLPLKAIRHPQRHLMDPHELHRLHSNHAEKRLAKFLRRSIPTDEEISLSKRFDRTGVPNDKLENTSSDLSLIGEDDNADTEFVATTVTVQTTLTTTVRTLFTTSTTTVSAGSPTDAPASDSTSSTSSSSDEEGQIKLENIGADVGYFAVVEIGTPPRPFNILMDSGSADLWVGSEVNCTEIGGRGGCGDHVFLGSSSSSSFQPSSDPFQVVYGSGEVRGVKVTDDVRLAGLDIGNLTFGMALEESEDFTGARFDGLMGLALSRISNQDTLTAIETLAQQGLVLEAITSYKVSRQDDGLDDGIITFGGLDESKFDPQTLVTFDNLDDGFWIGAIDSVKMDGADLNLQGQKAILDTGTTLMILPKPAADQIHAAIPDARLDASGERYTLPCDTTSVLSLSFGGGEFTIDPRDLSFAQVRGEPGRCVSGIGIGNFGDDDATWLVGDVFLKSVYFSHNASTNKMQLAKLV